MPNLPSLGHRSANTGPRGFTIHEAMNRMSANRVTRPKLSLRFYPGDLALPKSHWAVAAYSVAQPLTQLS